MNIIEWVGARHMLFNLRW